MDPWGTPETLLAQFLGVFGVALPDPICYHRGMTPERLAKLRRHAADPACTPAERATFERKIAQVTRVASRYNHQDTKTTRRWAA